MGIRHPRYEHFITQRGVPIISYPQSITGDIYDPDTKSWDLSGTHLIRQQDFWFAFGMTVFVIIPWFTVREVKVDVEIVSERSAFV